MPELSPLNMKLNNSSSRSCRILIGQLNWKPLESCEKDVNSLSQTNQKLCSSGNGTEAQHCKNVRNLILLSDSRSQCPSVLSIEPNSLVPRRSAYLLPLSAVSYPIFTLPIPLP